MRLTTLLSMALLTGFFLQPQALFAQDQTPTKGDTKGDAKGDAKGAEAAPHAAKHASQGGTAVARETRQSTESRGDKANARISGDATTTRAEQATRRATTNSNASGQGYQQAAESSRGQSSRHQSQTYAVQGNQANRYNGQWSPANSHSDWDQQTNHRWNNHDYRWYDGGWLIIEPGYATVNVDSGSIGSDVQSSLTQQGYYHGPIDGYIGRGTRHAISHYQSDNGLPVSGRIDGPLLASLKLE